MYIEVITLVFLCLCIFGAFLPMMPGIPLMFITTLVYAFVSDFTNMDPWHLWIFGGITIAALFIDWTAGLLGAKFGGAARKSLLAGFLGMIVGFVLFPPFGIIIGLFLGILIAEIARHRTGEQALKSAASSLIATAGGVVVNVVLAFAYVITFAIIVFI